MPFFYSGSHAGSAACGPAWAVAIKRGEIESVTKQIISSQNEQSYEKDNQLRIVGGLPEKYKIFGENLRAERKRHGFSLKDMAALLNMTPSYVGMIERGDCNPRLSVIYDLCDIFNVTPNYFFTEVKKNGTPGVGWATIRTAGILLNNLSGHDMNIVIKLMKEMLYESAVK